MKKVLKEKGITLIALVVTIIILLILVGVTLGIALSENGIIGRALKAKEMYNIAEYKDILEVIGQDAKLQQIEEKWDTKTYMDKYAEKIENNEKFKKSIVQRTSEEKSETEIEEKIIVETKEKYVFLITEQGVEYLGKQGDKGLELPPELQEGDIKYSKTQSDWTNKPVEVKIWTEKSDFTLEYSLDNKVWRKYNESVKLIAENNNTKFYARLVNKIGQANGENLTITVDNIDREKPEEFTAEGIGNVTNIEAIGNAVDKEATDVDGKSGIDKYYFSINNGDTWLPEEGVKVEEGKESKYTITNLNKKTKYKLITRAVDKAGNERISKETEIETTVETYTITYNLNIEGEKPIQQIKKEEEDIEILGMPKTKSKYGFKGWTTNENAEGAEIEFVEGQKYTEDKNLTLYGIWEGIKVGETVDYKYDEYIDEDDAPADGGYTILGKYSGYGTYNGINLITESNQTIKQEIKEWKVMNINDDGSVDLMGIPKPENTQFILGGAIGYNNGVYLLNLICNTLYSNKKLETKARNINFEDIENKLNDTGKNTMFNCLVPSGAGTVEKYGQTSYVGRYYPKIYKYENESGVNSTSLKTDGIGRSDDGTNKTKVTDINIPMEHTASEEGYEIADYIIIKQTIFGVDQTNSYYDDKEFYNLLFNTQTTYWLASRSNCCYGNGYYAFDIVSNSSIKCIDIFRGDGNPYCYKVATICPVVHLNSNILLNKKGDVWTLTKI